MEVMPLSEHTPRRAELIDYTPAAPFDSQAAKPIYAKYATAALGIGFGVAALSFLGLGRSGRIAKANAAVSGVCFALSLTSRIVASRARPMTSARNVPLRDESDGSPIDYTIIIPIYNRPHEAKILLPALSRIGAKAKHLGSGEILVVDDGSTDNTVAVVRELASAMTIPTRVISKPNGGVSSARNAGFAHARGKVGIVIDSDCIPEDSWLEAMLCAVQQNPQLLAFGRIRREKRPVYPLENLPDCKGFVGASYAMRKDAYLSLGGCYERYGASHDDRDLFLIAQQNGFDAAHPADAWIAHPLRLETFRSMWRGGLNSKYSNLFASRHGVHAIDATRGTPYYFFGFGGNYGSSVAFIVSATNLVLLLASGIGDRGNRRETLRSGAGVACIWGPLYVLGLCALGVVTRARIRDLPRYIAMLGTFQIATTIGRLKGTVEYGIVLL
jgi:glycosyltransferase involved in cell wall biosynthesis